MGRRRQYGSAAEKQRAYRERLDQEMVRVHRQSLERLEAQLERLQEAVRAAARAGDATAQTCTEPSMEGMLTKMTRYFEGKVANHEAERLPAAHSKRREDS